MDLNFTFLNVFILFGAIQGFVLCLYLNQKRNVNPASIKMFMLFLFSLAFLNMMYAFLDLNFFKYYRPLHVFPFPYKWLIGPAFYFYIKNQFLSNNEPKFHIKEWWLFVPAILYFFLRLYWFSVSVSENSYRITSVVVASNYFRIQEVFIMIFNVVLGLVAMNFLGNKVNVLPNNSKYLEQLKWLKKFVLVFVVIAVFNFLTYSVDLILHNGRETFLFLYPNLIINVGFIYWIGFIGFSKPKRLFNSFKSRQSSIEEFTEDLNQKLHQAITSEEVFTNPNLTLTELATQLKLNPKELSKYINEVHQMNFSEFLNFHRIKKVKELLKSSDVKKYTLVTLAEDAGFSSKSSFNSTFKRMVGMTPSEYKKSN